MENINSFRKARLLDSYNALEKAKAYIGEIREWNGQKYKKVKEGQWVKLKETKQGVKEQEVAESGMKKVIQSEIASHRKVLDDILADYKKKWIEKNGDTFYSVVTKVKFAREQELDDTIKQAREHFNKIYKDLSEDLAEVHQLQEKKAKQKREELVGKREVDEKDNYFKDNFDAFHTLDKQLSSIKDYLPASQIAPIVSVDNYWLDTEVVFQSIYEYNLKDADNNGVWQDPVEKKWEEIRNSGKFEFTQSPKSSSQYLVDRATGDVYRKADHWGRCASCYWGTNMNHNYGIAKANIKDFKRTDGSWVNPEKIKAYVSTSEVMLDKLKEMVTNDSIYFTKGANERLKMRTKKIEVDYLKYGARLKENELNELKQKYKELFEL